MRRGDGPRRRAQRGVTLVEVAASSLVLALTFITAVVLYRKAHDLEYEGTAHYYARRIADSFLDRAEYRYTRYDDFPETPTEWIHPEADRPVLHLSDNHSATIDLRVRTRREDAPGADWMGGAAIPYKVIEVVVSWGTPTQSVTVSKRIAKLQ